MTPVGAEDGTGVDYWPDRLSGSRPTLVQLPPVPCASPPVVPLAWRLFSPVIVSLWFGAVALALCWLVITVGNAVGFSLWPLSLAGPWAAASGALAGLFGGFGLLNPLKTPTRRHAHYRGVVIAILSCAFFATAALLAWPGPHNVMDPYLNTLPWFCDCIREEGPDFVINLVGVVSLMSWITYPIGAGMASRLYCLSRSKS